MGKTKDEQAEWGYHCDAEGCSASTVFNTSEAPGDQRSADRYARSLGWRVEWGRNGRAWCGDHTKGTDDDR